MPKTFLKLILTQMISIGYSIFVKISYILNSFVIFLVKCFTYCHINHHKRRHRYPSPIQLDHRGRKKLSLLKSDTYPKLNTFSKREKWFLLKQFPNLNSRHLYHVLKEQFFSSTNYRVKSKCKVREK